MPAGGMLSGFVYVDADNDGARDPGEIGVPGVVIHLSQAGSGDAADRSTITADNGFYYLVKPNCPSTTWSSGGAGECNPPSVCPAGGRDGNLP